MSFLRRLCRSEAGGTAVEYALLGAIIGLGTLSALNKVRSSLNTNFQMIASSLNVVQRDTVYTTPTGTTYVRSVTVNPDGSMVITRTRQPDGLVEYTENYDKSGNLTSVKHLNSDGSYYADIFSKNSDGSYTVTNTNSNGTPGPTYNQAVTHQDGYDIVKRTFAAGDAATYGSVQVYVINANTQQSNATPDYNPNLLGQATRYPNGTVTSSGTVSATKYF